MLSINLNTKLITAADHYPATSQAYRLGVVTAQLQELCLPAMYFRHRDDTRDFARGHESVAGPTLLSRQILGKVQQ